MTAVAAAPDVALELPAEPQAAAVARRAVDEAGGLPVATAEDLRLVVSELIVRAVLSGRGPIGLAAWLAGHPIRVEVTMPAGAFDPAAGLRGGGALELVDRLARAWTVVREDGRTVAAVELDRVRGA